MSFDEASGYRRSQYDTDTEKVYKVFIWDAMNKVVRQNATELH